MQGEGQARRVFITPSVDIHKPQEQGILISVLCVDYNCYLGRLWWGVLVWTTGSVSLLPLGVQILLIIAAASGRTRVPEEAPEKPEEACGFVSLNGRHA